MTPSISDQESLLCGEACWSLLERVASSSQMKKAGRLRNLLLYVGRRSLKEGCLEIHEKEIGIEVFGRQETYDTSIDNIVRSNVSDLRKRIDGYFSAEGLSEPVIMEIPRGSYVPVFRLRPVEPSRMAEPPTSAVSQLPNEPEDLAAIKTASESQSGTTRRLLIWALSIACVILSAGFAWQWFLNREMMHSFYPWRYEPSVASLWSGFVDGPKDTDIVMADTSFRLFQVMTKESFTLQDYLNRSYLRELDERNLSPDMSAALKEITTLNLGTHSETKLAISILALDPAGNKLHLYDARDYLPDLLKKDNVILVGSQFGNPWDELFQGRLNFIAKDDINSIPPSAVIINRGPAAGEQPIYKPAGSVAYCTVAYLPNPQANGNVLLIGGIGTGSLEGAKDFLLSETQLSNFQKLLHVEKLPYFEVLIKVPIVKGTPVNETVLAYRVYPNGLR